MTLAGLAAALFLALVYDTGPAVSLWRASVLVIAVLSAAWWLFSPRADRAPALPRFLLWPALLLPGFAALQLVPLPAPLRAPPAASLRHLVQAAACLLVFLLVREIAWRSSNRRWLPVFPLVLAGALQAALGLAQFHSGVWAAHGTYVNRNHFAGFLEMTLPFAAVYPYAVLIRSRSRSHSAVRPAAVACGGISVAAVILLAIVYSLSRMGFAVAISTLTAVGIGLLSVSRSRGFGIRMAGACACVALSVCAFVFLAPEQLIARFGQVTSVADASTRDRIGFWKEALPVIAANPVFGCGFGGYEAVTGHFAHNDYLQYLAELGVLGSLIPGALLVGVMATAIRAARRHVSPDGRALAVACAGAVAAILLHSLVDFNLHIPANALCLAWISGLAVSLMFDPEWQVRKSR